MGILGHPIRIVSAGAPSRLYLTFDDGPHPSATPAILSVLERHNVPATFFLVGRKSSAHPERVQAILRGGHAVGDHSSDHAYGHFFRGRRHVREWIARSDEALSILAGRQSVGFRPPAGVRTPELGWALRDLDIPLVLWKVRFFDAVVPWRPLWALASLQITPPGAIILLHDGQSPGRLPSFLATLEAYLEAARQRGFTFAALPRNLLRAASGRDAAPHTSRNTGRG